MIARFFKVLDHFPEKWERRENTDLLPGRIVSLDRGMCGRRETFLRVRCRILAAPRDRITPWPGRTIRAAYGHEVDGCFARRSRRIWQRGRCDGEGHSI